jgi:signal transduction histidine kinase
MKRKIILGLLLQTAVFLAAGFYIASKLRAATDDVDHVVRLHQVAHLRERYLLQLKVVQSDLARSGSTDVAVASVASMESTIELCYGCHHSAESTHRLGELNRRTERYRDALARLPAAGAGSDARHAEGEAAFRMGEELAVQVEDMIDRTTRNLERHTLEAMGDIARTKYLVYGLVVLGPLLSALLGLVWIASLTRPLDALLEATRKLEAGDLDHRVEGLRDEFKELAVSFNDMASSLKEQMQMMQRTEHLVVVGELAAGLVHEIKNPLAGIKAAVQILSGEAELSEEDRCVLEKVGREVVGLEALLKAFLEFAKPARPQLAVVDVNGLIESVVAFYMRSHAMKVDRPVLITKALGPVPPARLDPMQLQQILLNLLLNAVEAMPNGGAVEVRTAFDDRSGVVRIDIADGGGGISPEHAGQIFQPFFTTKSGGTGLGLAVSKRLAEQHGGSITFSQNPGGGTIFRIQLPPAAPAGARAA